MEHLIVIINSILVISVVLITLLVNTHGDERHRHESSQILSSGLITTCILVFPILYGYIVGWSHIYTHPILVIGIVWTVILLLYDLYQTRIRTVHDYAAQKVATLKQNTAILITASFAVGSLLAVARKKNGIGEASESVHSARILLISLVLCVAFVIPITTDMDPRGTMSRLIGSVQESMLKYAIGLFVGGIIASQVIHES